MYTGSNIVTDGLAFGYDSYYGGVQGAATRFYKGEPTSNLIPSSERNGRFTTSNSWGSYNTNQYNGNNDFNIGTIGSVSNNIVTLSSVGHVIRSFDVLNPATSGGGVTAGTNYVVKKISNNTFSLHAYNSSQNGSQGYINPDTNFYKVHDAYANDTRISISASGFPNMWHGAAHLPNSGLIKEIVPNGGYVKGTNSMRLHIYRGDAVVDGMAYNVYIPVTQGDVITVSYWVKPTNANAYGKTWNYQTYFGAGNGTSSFTTTLNSTGDWQHVVHQWTASVTYNFYSYWFPQGSTDKYAFDMADLHVEVNKGHATPFSDGTRSNTDSLIDLTRTTNIDMSNSSFDTTGQPDLDGAGDFIKASSTHSITGDITLEAIFNEDTASSPHTTVICTDTGHQYGVKLMSYKNTNRYGLWLGFGSSSHLAMVDETLNNNTMYHLVGSWDQSTGVAKIYLNGVLKSTQSTGQTSAISLNEAKVVIGADYHSLSYGLNGNVYVGKVYNKVLTDDEVTKNYKAYKNRFNI